MNKNIQVHYSSNSNEWETPKFLFELLNRKYIFDLDAAATKDNSLCKNYFDINNNSLEQDWSKYKTIWLNPPYGRLIGKFVKKAYEESLKGCCVVLLIPSRVDTSWWHDYCSKGVVYFIKGRLKFINKTLPSYNKDGNFKVTPAPFPSAIVIFNNKNKPETKYVNLKTDIF